MHFKKPMKTIPLYCVIALWLALPSTAQVTEWQGEVRHSHRMGSCRGNLQITSRGIAYRTEHKKHAREWSYLDLKAVHIAPGKVLLSTYDKKKPFILKVKEGEIPADVMRSLLESFPKTLIVNASLPPETTLFEIPAAHRHRRGACQGILRAGTERLTFESDQSAHSRTWRYGDVSDVHSLDSFELTLTTREYQKFRYAGNRVFRFQLKEPIAPSVYQDLWRRVNFPSAPGTEARK